MGGIVGMKMAPETVLHLRVLISWMVCGGEEGGV